ncbi:MAG TPA: DUF2911 domain-containing protein [Gemmatimonadaceae bacterium]
MSQTIDGTVITVEYSRPRARGRDTIFGTKAVRWDETWTPGANWATTLDVSKPVTINGTPVAKGKYSVWMKVRQNEPWTFILEPDSHRYHMYPPDSSASQIRVAVKPEANPFTDVLTWSMPEMRMDGGTLEFRWERVRIPLDVTVQPSLVMTFPANEARDYVGEYRFVEADSTGKDGKVSAFTISYEDNTLKGRWTPDDPYMKKFAFIRVGPDLFVPGVYDQSGKIYEVLKPDFTAEFKRTNGRVTSFTLRDMEDNLWGTGTRK